MTIGAYGTASASPHMGLAGRLANHSLDSGWTGVLGHGSARSQDYRVGLDYWIWPGLTSRLGSSLSDHFGRLPARTLSAQLVPLEYSITSLTCTVTS